MEFISSMLQDLLNILFSFTGDFGFSIVLITLGVKLLLMPLSLKQKFAMKRQLELSKEVEDLKKKYKNNQRELEKQLEKYSQESLKSMMGCSTILIQMPIVGILYNTFFNMSSTYSSILIPWVSSINVADNLFIVPCIYTLTSLMPSLINLIPYFKLDNQAKFNKNMVITTVVMSFLLTAKTPVAVGIYLITSSIYSLIEDVCYKVYVKKQNTMVIN